MAAAEGGFHRGGSGPFVQGFAGEVERLLDGLRQELAGFRSIDRLEAVSARNIRCSGPIQNKGGGQFFLQKTAIDGEDGSYCRKAGVKPAAIGELLERPHPVAGEPSGQEGAGIVRLGPPGRDRFVTKEEEGVAGFLFTAPERSLEFQQDLDDGAIAQLAGGLQVTGDSGKELKGGWRAGSLRGGWRAGHLQDAQGNRYNEPVAGKNLFCCSGHLYSAGLPAYMGCRCREMDRAIIRLTLIDKIIREPAVSSFQPVFLLIAFMGPFFIEVFCTGPVHICQIISFGEAANGIAEPGIFFAGKFPAEKSGDGFVFGKGGHFLQ